MSGRSPGWGHRGRASPLRTAARLRQQSAAWRHCRCEIASWASWGVWLRGWHSRKPPTKRSDHLPRLPARSPGCSAPASHRRWRVPARARHPTGARQTGVWQTAKHTGPAARRAGRTGRTRALTPRRDGVRYPPMSETAETLRRLHVEGPMLVLPNAWHAGSARIFIEAGFKALATTSAGIAFSLGYPDGERISRDEMLAAVSRITRRIDVPITADMEAGYGMPPKAVAETVRRVIDAGAVGMNLEDRMEGKRLIDFPLAVERVGAARAAADAAGIPFVLNARTDAFEAPELRREERLTEAVRRGNAFREAGADSVFVPFVGDYGTIDQLVQLIRAPLNILGTPNAPSLKEMAALGVRRVTFGSAPMRATLGLIRRMAREWKEKGTYATLEAYGVPFADLQQLFG